MASNHTCLDAIRNILTNPLSSGDRLAHLRELFALKLIDDNSRRITKEDLLTIERDNATQATKTGEQKPHLFVLCRRSDETLPVDSLYEPKEEFATALSLGGRAMFVHPTSKTGVMHIISDRLPSSTSGGGVDFRSALTELLAHEGTHAVDALCHGIDLSMVGPLACSEVRAAFFGECWETNKGSALFSSPSAVFSEWSKRRCVRRLASDSTELAFPGIGSSAVSAVFDWCYKTGLGENAVANSPLKDLKPAGAVEEVPTVVVAAANPLPPQHQQTTNNATGRAYASGLPSHTLR